MAVLSNSSNGFGYRANDYGNSIATATRLTASGTTYSAAGVISSPTAACSYTLTPSATSLPGSGGAGNFLVQAPSDCTWTATSHAEWITLTAGVSGTGNGAKP